MRYASPEKSPAKRGKSAIKVSAGPILLPSYSSYRVLVWARLRAELEPKVQYAKESQLEDEELEIRHNRRIILDRLFKAYKMTLSPSQWKYLPTTAILSGLQPFRGIVEAECTMIVTEASFSSSMEDIAETLAAAQADLKRRLVAQATAFYTESPHIMKGIEKHTPLGMFDLAVTVFECAECCEAVSGWDDIISHFCSEGQYGLEGPEDLEFYWDSVYADEYPYKYCINKRMVATAGIVVQAAGLDPASATATDMDMKDLRFACSSCDGNRAVSYPYLSGNRSRAHT